MPAVGNALSLATWRAPSAPPSTPADFTATPGDRETVLTWTASSGATGYEIKANTTDNIYTASVLGTGIAGTSFTHDAGESIQAGEKYFYWIKAIGSGGDSDFSSSISGRSYVTVGVGQSVNLTTPSGEWTLSTLFFGATAFPPGSGFVTIGADIYAGGPASGWEDIVTADPSDNLVVSGAFTFEHNSASPVTFWNGEP